MHRWPEAWRFLREPGKKDDGAALKQDRPVGQDCRRAARDRGILPHGIAAVERGRRSLGGRGRGKISPADSCFISRTRDLMLPNRSLWPLFGVLVLLSAVLLGLQGPSVSARRRLFQSDRLDIRPNWSSLFPAPTTPFFTRLYRVLGSENSRARLDHARGRWLSHVVHRLRRHARRHALARLCDFARRITLDALARKSAWSAVSGSRT